MSAAKITAVALLTGVLATGCAHAPRRSVPTATVARAGPRLATTKAVVAHGTARKAVTTSRHATPAWYSWMRPPAPIAGRWKVASGPDCSSLAGMVVRIAIPPRQPTKATGRVVRRGAAAQLGYREGERVLRLVANDFGAWEGMALWRSVLGVKRWDPVYFVIKDGSLIATMAVDECWQLLHFQR